MFLLRCVFWLSIVYASMSLGSGVIGRHGSFDKAAAGGTSIVDAATGQAVAAASTLCAGHEARCLRDAAQMTMLVQATLRPDEDSESIVQDDTDVPLPPPAPRRHVASAVLTRGP